jgi:hypothetical protein
LTVDAAMITAVPMGTSRSHQLPGL